MGLKMEKKTIKKQIAFLTEELQITLPTTDRMMEKCSEILWKNLCPELEQLSVRLLIRDIHQLKREGKLRGRTARDQYLFYEDKYLLEKDHIRKLRSRYPEWERLVQLQCRQFQDMLEQIAEAVKCDHEEIVSVFCGGREFSRIADMDLRAGDAHNGGRRAAKIVLDNGVTLYYKPHSIQKNIWYQKIYQNVCEEAGLEVCPIQYLERGAYGWEQQVEHRGCKKEEEVKRFYFRMGIHLFLGYALSATDLHGENIIAHGEFPIIVDFETYPGCSQIEQEAGAEKKLRDMLQTSVIHTGMLPVLTWGNKKDAAIISGLGNGACTKTPFLLPTLKNAGTTDVCIVYEPRNIRLEACRVLLNQEDVQPQAYTEELCRGFAFAYRRAMADSEMKEAMSVFFQRSARLLLRHTQQYAMYLFTSFHPDFCVSHSKRKELFSVLRPSKEDSLQKQIYEYERECLMNLDIPYFEVKGNSRSLFYGKGGANENYLKESLFDSWKRKIEGFEEADLERQLTFIRLSMGLLDHRKAEFSWNSRKREMAKMVANETDFLKSCCKRITDWICRSAVVAGEDITWYAPVFFSDEKWRVEPIGLSLYDGLAGIALYLAAYLKSNPDHAGKSIYGLAVNKLFRHTEKMSANITLCKNCKTGFLDGEGSLAAVYLILFRITGDGVFLEYAKKHFKIIVSIAQADHCQDFLSGNAGAIVIASELFKITGEVEFCHHAERMEAELWKNVKKQKAGWGFQIPGAEKPLAGLAHGNSGFMLAYGSLYEITRKEDYRRKIRKLWEYEDTLYSEEKKNWRDLRRPEPRVMNGWCHGAPGIFLVREKLFKLFKEEYIKQDLKRAKEALFFQPPELHLCLCHGISGNLLIMGQWLEKGEDIYYRKNMRNGSGYFFRSWLFIGKIMLQKP